MFDRQSIHVALLLWGCIFCLIAAVCIFMSKNFEKRKREVLLFMISQLVRFLIAQLVQKQLSLVSTIVLFDIAGLFRRYHFIQPIR